MARIVFLSPHLDDAAFSAGGLIAHLADRGCEIETVTLLTGSSPEPEGFALACQLDKGLPAEADYMALRRDEDCVAQSVLGAEARHIPLLEAPHRGYNTPRALFEPPLPGDPLEEELFPVVRELAAKADLVLSPYALGGHVDHVLVRKVAQAVVAVTNLVLWRDMPYAQKSGNVAEGWPRLGSDSALRSKLDACCAYATQIGFQFGGAGALRDSLRADWHTMGGEAFFPLSEEAQALLFKIAGDPSPTTRSRKQDGLRPRAAL